MRYLLIDSHNLFYRAIHVAKGGVDMQAGMALHIIFMSIAQSWRLFNADHVVVALECRTADNWRKLYDKRYKHNRTEGRAARTQREVENDQILFSTYDDYITYLRNCTNVTVLQSPITEADDMIAHWINTHPDDEHIIVSSDKDFQQMLSDNVCQFNGIDKKVISSKDSDLAAMMLLEGNFPTNFEMKVIDDPEFVLFEKIVRGDAGDNVFSAYPGVRKNPARGKPGLIPAYLDRHNKGYDWNCFMLARWDDMEGNEHVVRDDFARNKMLVDLKAHPEEVVAVMNESIANMDTTPKKKIGLDFFIFCNANNLERLQEKAESLTTILSAGDKVEQTI